MECEEPGEFWRACHQTADVDLFIGRDLTKVSVREGFLRRRSPLLAAKIDHSQGLGLSDDVILDDVSWETFCKFWEWLYMKEPRVPQFISLDEVLELGILATKYQVRALQHEVSDLLRQKVSRKEWKLGLSQIRRMLSCDEESPWLRQLVYASLCTIVVPQGNQQKVEVEEWLGILDQDPRLAREWKRSDFLRFGAGHITDGGACRFHDHGLVVAVEDSGGSCPYRKSELYPIGEGRRKGARKGKARRRTRIEAEVTYRETASCAEAADVEQEDAAAEEPVIVEEYM